MELTVKSVTPFAYAKAAPLLSAAHPGRYAALVAALVACSFVALSHRAIARDLTDRDILDIQGSVYGLVGGRDRVFGLRASWAGNGNGEVLVAWAIMRPVETAAGLCAMEQYTLRRRDGDEFFERDDIPLTRYWPVQTERSCSETDREAIPPSVSVWSQVPTADVVRIVHGADELLQLVTPEIRCGEPVMDRIFQPGAQLRLSSIQLRKLDASRVGYEAFFDWDSRSAGPSVYFELTPTTFEVWRSCFTNVDGMGPIPYLD